MTHENPKPRKKHQRRLRTRRGVIGAVAVGAASLALAVPAIASFTGGPSATDGSGGQTATALVTTEQESFAVRGERGGARGAIGADVAGVIGIDPADLREAVRGGQSLAEVAEANGVAVQSVVDAIVESMNERIDQAAESGRLSAEQATEARANAAERAEAIVQRRGMFPAAQRASAEPEAPMGWLRRRHRRCRPKRQRPSPSRSGPEEPQPPGCRRPPCRHPGGHPSEPASNTTLTDPEPSFSVCSQLFLNWCWFSFGRQSD